MKTKLPFSLKTIIIIILGFSSIENYAQNINLETISKEKVLKVNGGVSLNTLFTQGIPNTISPLNFFVAGNLNFNFLNTINVPVSINLTDRKVALSQGYSFNQISVNPTYKWVTAHLGTNYMSFSPYTLNGHQFLGVGFDLKPAKWNIQLMTGRLRKGQYDDTLTTGPTFKRMGYGAKVLYNPGTYLLGVTVFKSHDYQNTVPIAYRNTQAAGLITPEDNLVIALNFGTTLFHRIQLNTEYSNSIITRDHSGSYEKMKINSLAGFFANANATSNSYNAFKMNVNYNISSLHTIVGVGFEKVDPDYRTHGGYYFVNDIKNYTANISQMLLDNKLMISANVGLQKDNIKKTKANESKRIISSVNANYQVNQKLSLGFNFSNFQAAMFVNDLYSKITRVPGQIIDSLNFSMVSKTLAFNLNQLLKKTENQSSGIQFNTNYLQSQNKSGGVLDPNSKTNIYNTTLGYNQILLKRNLSWRLGANAIFNNMAITKMTGYGPTFSLQKSFLDKKLNTNLNFTWLKTKFSGTENIVNAKSASNVQFGASYAPKRKHNFNLNFGWVKSGASNPYINGNLGYNYSF